MPALTILLVLLIVRPAFAHGDGAHGSTLPWNFDPWIVVPLAVMALLYATGYVKLRSRARNGLPLHDRSAVLYLCGWLSLALALVTPLHELGEASFTAHMIEHEIVMALAAPLLVLARPTGVLLWGLPGTIGKSLGKVARFQPLHWAWTAVGGGAAATVLHGAAIWGWHAPPLFDATIDALILHRLQHLSFFLTALLFWRAVLWRSSPGIAAWHLFVTMLHTGLLGALIALAPGVLYEAQTRDAARFGLTALEDQQLAGLIMWIPAGTVYVGAALYMLAKCINRSAGGVTHGRR